MKILIATTYIYRKEWPEFTRNRTGFGIMVNDIYEAVSESNEVYLLSQVITHGHGNVLKHMWTEVFGNAKPKDWIKGFHDFFNYQQGVKNRARYFYYALNSGAIRKALRNVKPDVVHIHGIGMAVKPYIDACESENVPYIVTLHGLIGLDQTVSASLWDKQMEKEFLIRADEENIPVTVISSGMKRRIEKHYLHHEAKNITVVCNGTRIPYNEKLITADEIDLRKEFHLHDEKIAVVIGTVCERKNQIQIVKAVASGKITTPCQFFFCGSDVTNGEVKGVIHAAALEDKIHVLGFLPHEKIEQILKQADLNIVASKDEGFGFSIIEAYCHGVPTVTFSDLDSVPDLYDQAAMIKVDSRDDVSLANGIETGLRKEWNRSWIKEYSKSYSLEKLAKQYEHEYVQIINRGGHMPLAKAYDYLRMQRLMGKKILSYVGNITANKNQIALVAAMKEMRDEGIIAVLAGREADDGTVRNFVIANQLQNCVLLTGFCNEMSSIWENVDLNIFVSKNDGFGLSIIEGNMYGVPCVACDDLDAIPDVYDENAMILCNERTDDALASTTESALQKKWDAEWVMSYSNKFSLHQMGERYIALYKKVIQENI